MPVGVGDVAPEFELFGEYDRERDAYVAYRLSEAFARQPMVLHFFPAPFTRVCLAQMEDVRDHIEDLYGSHGVGVWGITGHYPWLIAKWVREYSFGVPILADYEHIVSQEYVGTYPPDVMSGLKHTTIRGVIAVGMDGIVRSVWTTEDPEVGPTGDDVAAAIAAAKK